MELWKWSEDYSVGNIILDEQNKYFLKCINEFTIIDHSLAVYIIEVVILYANTHFEAEEELLSDIGYTDLDSHIEQHKHFLMELGEIEGRLHIEKITLDEIQKILIHWFTEHICKEDKKYRELLSPQSSKTL